MDAKSINGNMLLALGECAAPFIVGTEAGFDWEGLAREFNRRQRVARDAIRDAIEVGGEMKGEAESRK